MASIRPNDVFLNLPFDNKRERLFLAYLATLVSLGLNPRCVLEIDPSKKKLSTEADCKWVYRRLMRIRRSEIQGTVFRPTAFAKLVAAAIALSDLRLGGSGLSQ